MPEVILHTTRLCKLEDGSIAPYDLAADSKDAYTAQLIGYGEIWEINGVTQTPGYFCYFYKEIA
jgi:hypothetical protein